LERTGERVLHYQAKTKFASDSIKQHTTNVVGYIQKLKDEMSHFYEILLKIDNEKNRPQQETRAAAAPSTAREPKPDEESAKLRLELEAAREVAAEYEKEKIDKEEVNAERTRVLERELSRTRETSDHLSQRLKEAEADLESRPSARSVEETPQQNQETHGTRSEEVWKKHWEKNPKSSSWCDGKWDSGPTESRDSTRS
jgi:hypothetical protein